MARKDSIKKLAEVLLGRRKALIQVLDSEHGLLSEISGKTTADVIDTAMSTAAGEIYSRLAEAESRELAHIQYALEKIKDCSYGKCEACNCSIPLARLEALPYAVLCVSCKRKAEDGSIASSSDGDWSHVTDDSHLA